MERDETVTRIVFLGPTLALETLAELPPDVRVFPPIERGDIEKAEQRFPNLESAGIIDGKLFQALSVSPKEILRFMDRGKRVWGSSGIGALRASELHMFGMRGVGQIYNLFVSGELDADDEVLRTYDPETWEATSVPMVDIRLALASAQEQGLVEEETAQVAIRAAKQLHYAERRYETVLGRLQSTLEPGRWTSLAGVFDRPRQCSSEDAFELLAAMGILKSNNTGPDEGGVSETCTPLQSAAQRRIANRSHWPATPGVQGAPPMRKRFAGVRPIMLPVPVAALPEAFGDVLTRRRSIREYADQALGLDQLSMLLYHSARAIAIPGSTDTGLRPFAAGGARSELEIYVLAQNIAGLDAGAYYYDPFEHNLTYVRAADESQKAISDSVLLMAGKAEAHPPQAIFLITAVFERILWKYGDLGPSLIYKNVGCLMQTIYLVCTAMGLAPCAMGGGDEARNSRWLGLNPGVECQVGCIMVGTLGRSNPDRVLGAVSN